MSQSDFIAFLILAAPFLWFTIEFALSVRRQRKANQEAEAEMTTMPESESNDE